MGAREVNKDMLSWKNHGRLTMIFQRS